MTVEIIKGVKTEVEVNVKRIKHDYIRITSGPVNESKIILSIRRKMKDSEILDLIESKRSFIEKCLKRNSKYNTNDLEDNQIMLFGKVFNCHYSNSYKNVDFMNNDIYGKDENAIILYAIEIIKNRFTEIQEKNRFPKTTLYFSNMKSRWGVCYPTKHRIGLTKALIHVPFDCLDYVIYHEFTHYKHMNHSANFHKELKKYCSDEKELRKKLKNYSNYMIK